MLKMARFVTMAIALFSAGAGAGFADDDCDEECQAVRKAQDPLADVRAIMTDNTIGFGTSNNDDTVYGFQIQPVYSIPTDLGFNFIARGIVPLAGVDQGSSLPKLGSGPAGGSGSTFGIGDIMAQGFFVPQLEDFPVKFGFGPQVSLRSRTDDAVGGPGWGAGAAAVFFGFAGDISYGGIFGHHWGQDDFSLSTIQPILMYNTPFLGGSYIGYNNSITYDWSARAGNRWQVPVGAVVGKTFAFDSGHAIDVNLGSYGLVERPTGGQDWQLKFGVSVFFP